MSFKLTNKQKEALPYIKWLLNPQGARAEGRTTLLAYTFLELARQYPIWIQVFDHHRHVDSRRRVIEEIQRIKDQLPEYKNYNLHINPNSFEIRLYLKGISE